MAFAVSRPCYCTREQVKRAIDVKETARNNQKIDRAIEAASENIDGILHRRFYITDETFFWDWPNYQYAYPWRLWLDKNELADVTSNVPVVTSGGVVIPSSNIFWGPWNYSPPFTYIELDRSSNASFGIGPTPQRDISITGTFGYWLQTDVLGALASSVSNTSTSIVISDGSFVGVGMMLIADSERMLVTNITSADTGQELLSGCTTALASDDTMTIANGSDLNPDEILLVDSERMLVIDITGNNVIVKRGWDGTVLTTHDVDAEIYAYRNLWVNRGGYGTTAASHSEGITLYALRVPSLIRDLAIAEASVQVIEEIGGYSDLAGEGISAGIGEALPDKWDEAEAKYARKGRIRAI